MTRLRDLIVAAFRAAVANKTLSVAIALGVAVAVTYGFLFDWEWKAMIGWKALEGYINPGRHDTTAKKDAVQVYAVIVAGVIASITAAVGLANLRLTRKNLEQQRELEAQRAEQQRELEAQRSQGTALQAYYEQIGKLITDNDLLNTERKVIRELARGQTLTVLQEIDGKGKGSLLTFLHGAGLVAAEDPAVMLFGANLQEADLPRADLHKANLDGADLLDANLQFANLHGADLHGSNLLRANLQFANLRGANLHGADLPGANLSGANLSGAILQEAILHGAKVTDEQLAGVQSLQGATMPDGSEYP